ncbi:hypothetical protein [Mycobacterium sp. 1423905.2]|nr:hypothetical protein [Mycobacterium sp. 1423905.2]
MRDTIITTTRPIDWHHTDERLLIASAEEGQPVLAFFLLTHVAS